MIKGPHLPNLFLSKFILLQRLVQKGRSSKDFHTVITPCSPIQTKSVLPLSCYICLDKQEIYPILPVFVIIYMLVFITLALLISQTNMIFKTGTQSYSSVLSDTSTNFPQELCGEWINTDLIINLQWDNKTSHNEAFKNKTGNRLLSSFLLKVGAVYQMLCFCF